MRFSEEQIVGILKEVEAGAVVVLWRAAGAKAVPEDEDDSADDPPVIDPRHSTRQRKMGLNPGHLKI